MGCSGGKQEKKSQQPEAQKLCPICDEKWLQQATSPSGDAFCNICESEFCAGDSMYGCRDCDYDECGVCFAKAFYLPFKVNDVPVIQRQGTAYIVDLAGLTSQDVTLPDPGDQVEVMETFWSNEESILESAQLLLGETGFVTKDDGEAVGGDGSVKVKFNSQEEAKQVLPENFKNLKVLGEPRKLGYRNSKSIEDQSGRAVLHFETIYGAMETTPDGVEWLKIGNNKLKKAKTNTLDTAATDGEQGEQGDGQQAPVIDKKCPACDKHILQKTEVSAATANAFCNSCQYPVRPGDFLFGCRVCDWDECGECVIQAVQLGVGDEVKVMIECQSGNINSELLSAGDIGTISQIWGDSTEGSVCVMFSTGRLVGKTQLVRKADFGKLKQTKAIRKELTVASLIEPEEEYELINLIEKLPTCCKFSELICKELTIEAKDTSALKAETIAEKEEDMQTQTAG